MPVDILLVFSDRDKDGAAELERHLTPLSRADKIRLWHRGKILSGEDADKKWREQVERAQIILFLVSADLEIDRDSEITAALDQRHARNARVIPVLWRAVNVNELRYREMRMIPDGSPVSARRDRDQAWVEVVQGISKVVAVMPAAPAAAPAAPQTSAAPGAGTPAGAPSGAASAAPTTPQSPPTTPQSPPAAPAPAPDTGRIKILFIGANPVDTTRLMLSEEMNAIERRILQGSHRERFDLRSAWAVTAADLSHTLLRHTPGILHFSGHGGHRGEIILNDESGRSQTVAGPALARLFKIFVAKGLRCVVLNSCYSQEQAAALAQHVDCVIGITGEIVDSAAFAFAAGFYTGLAQGETIQTAFDLGCAQIAIMGGPDPDQAKLIGRPGVDLEKLRLA